MSKPTDELVERLNASRDAAEYWINEFYEWLVEAGDDPVRLHQACTEPRSADLVPMPYVAVLALWERLRRPDGPRNPITPDRREWRLAEHFVTNVGRTFDLDQQREILGVQRGYAGPAAAELVAKIANANIGKIAPVYGRHAGGSRVTYGLMVSPVVPPMERWGAWDPKGWKNITAKAVT